MLRSPEAQVNQRKPKRFAAHVQFVDPDEARPAIAALVAAGCKYEYDPDLIDEFGPTEFGWVTGTTELTQGELAWWLLDFLGPAGLLEWKVFD